MPLKAPTSAVDNRVGLLCLLALSAVLPGGCSREDAAPTFEGPDPLETIGARATEGAAAGYVADAVCGTCHGDKVESYQHVGMAQSLRAAGNQAPMERFGEPFYFEPLQRWYEIVERDNGLVFRRYQQDDDGNAINLLELPIAWVLGSGNRARSYLYQNDWGEIFMLPVGWYSEDDTWGMSPGFELASNHPGISRAVTRKCLFCHNAFPETAAGTDVPWREETFPHDLPEGTGCQRCHGPGADHIRSALSGRPVAETAAAIVNPADLTPERRDSVCFQCHMLPSASVEGIARFGVGTYSFRPGQSLSDYFVHMDIVEAGERPEDRFEINHHGYRFALSACYLESEGEFACINCHDPHVKPESTRFRADVANVCRDCHATPESLHAATTEYDESACVSCHMPTRRTGDVVLVTMTDHRIATGPFDHDALVASQTRVLREVTDIHALDLGDPPTGQLEAAYRSVAALRAGRNLAPAQRTLEEVLSDLQLPDNEPYVDLATAQFRAGRFAEAEASARRLIAEQSHLRPAYAVLGTALLAQGARNEAIEALQASLSIGEHPETHFNLAAAYSGLNDYRQAETHVDAAIRLRPTMGNAWKYKARLLYARDEDEAARDAFIRTLALQPLDLPVYGELIDLLRSLGQADEAERYLALGLRMSRLASEL
jgi:predicted CXXCH cytochrome family protein